MTSEYSALKAVIDPGDENAIDSKKITSLPTKYFRNCFEEVDSFYDCFLAHEWGSETSEFLTHEGVIGIVKD